MSGSGFTSQSLSTPLPAVKYFVTSSYFVPYVTTIGLYNDQYELLAVAKVSEPIQRTFDVTQTFTVRFDT
jgi:hypothetical protein